MLSKAEELIAGLRESISQDTFIPKFFKRIEDAKHPQDASCLMQLETAIKNGDLNNEIFSNQHCSLYLLYLIENEKIPFWEGISAYYYCMALMQFTDKQPLHVKDQDDKLYQHVFAVPFMKDGQVTLEGKQYLQAIQKRYATEMPALRFNPDEVVLRVKNFSRMNQSLICISPDGFNDIDNPLWPVFNKTKKSIVNETLCLADNLPIEMDGEVLSCLVIPSFAFMDELHKMNSTSTVTFKPMMGWLDRKALEKLHRKKDAHPFALYRPFTSGQGKAENVTSVYEDHCGPFLASLSDIRRVAKANFLNHKDRQFLVREVVPDLTLYRGDERILAGLKNPELFSERMDEILFRLTDYGCLNAGELNDCKKDSWQVLHLFAALKRCRVLGLPGEEVDRFDYGLYADIHPDANTEVWNLVDDDVLYFIGCIADRRQGFWSDLYQKSREAALHPAYHRHRNPKVLDEIEAAVGSHKPECARRLNFSGCLFREESTSENSMTPKKKDPKPNKPNALSVKNFRS